MMMQSDEPSKAILKTADRYIKRMRNGELMMRDSAGRVQWADGRRIGMVTFRYMIDSRIIAPLDTDLLGDPSRG